MVDEEAFYHHVGGNVLCDLIRAHGAERIYQVNDDKIGEREVDISDFDVPNHADDWYRFDDSFDWFIATTHNNLAVIAGDWLVSAVKTLWPNWADYPYTPPWLKSRPSEERPTREEHLKSRRDSEYYRAVYQGRTEEIAALLDEGWDIQTPIFKMGSALHYAAARGQIDVAALLIQRGADINARSGYGVTPLMDAVSNGHVTLIAQLLAASADKSLRADSSEHAKARAGLTALEIAEQSPYIAALGKARRLEILELLG
ncbi:MAG: uncharacterized protein JWQ02_3272 [Capsulimonas sp.]|nr:uncharacterized protein [Capsulimonas sp.]